MERNIHKGNLVGRRWKSMKTIVLDLEFCKVKKGERKNAFPLKEEIIEIGAIMLDEEMQEINYYKSYIKPDYSSVSPYIQNLTGITNEMLSDKRSFAEVIREFVAWIGDDEFQIHSWSMSDYYQLFNEIEKKMNINEYQRLFDGWVDDQKAFAKALGIEYELSLSYAISSIDENFEGAAHDALNDAKNTARIVALMADKDEFNHRMKSIQELFKPKESGTTLGSMFGDIFANFVVA